MHCLVAKHQLTCKEWIARVILNYLRMEKKNPQRQRRGVTSDGD
jgi:hypothetical protein